MKIISILGYPLTIISSFFLLLISGRAFGGPYIIYLLLGLPHGADYSIFAIFGILSLCVTMYITRPNKNYWIKSALMIAGIILLGLSLFVFFQNDRMRYNYATFEQTVPVISIVVFGITVLCGLIISVMQILNFHTKKIRALNWIDSIL